MSLSVFPEKFPRVCARNWKSAASQCKTDSFQVRSSDQDARPTAIAAKEIITAMLDQIFGQLFSSQWIVFAVLVILLVGLSELAWRMGLARSRKKVGSRQGQRHREICSAGSVRIVAWIQFCYRRSAIR